MAKIHHKDKGFWIQREAGEKVNIHLLKKMIIYVFKVQISLVQDISCLFYFHIPQTDNGMPIN